MEGLDLLHMEQWQPLAAFGLKGSLFTINAPTVLNTWIIIGIVALVLIPIKKLLTRKKSFARFCVVSMVEALVTMCQQALGSVIFNHIYFIGALFGFIALCNASSIIPWLEEPTQDINTTLALGIISFSYTQVYAIKHNGLKSYLKEFFQPFFILFPLNIIGHFATIISISFRLFGNIFGGATIGALWYNLINSSIYLQIFGIASGLNLLIAIFFGMFEGLLQAFVFAMLTLTYLSIATQTETTQGTTQ